MTCFWNGLISGINKYHNKIKINNNPIEFVKFLKNNNKKTKSVIWNNKMLTSKQLIENYDSIIEYDISCINQGYLCSSFDPFIFLVAELFKININHNIMNKTSEQAIIKYTYKNAKNIIFVRSNTEHFSIK